MSSLRKKKQPSEHLQRKVKQSSSVSFYRQVQPKALSGILPYASIGNTIVGTTGATGVQIYSANGMYDPDVTITGHQPRGFDNYMALYDHYLVRKCHLEVVFTPANVDVNIGIAIRDGTTTEVAQSYIESPNMVWDVLLASATQPKKLSLTVDIAKFLNRANIQDNKELQGSSTLQPDEEVYFHVFIQSADASSSTGNCYITSKLKYWATFREPTQPSAS